MLLNTQQKSCGLNRDKERIAKLIWIARNNFDEFIGIIGRMADAWVTYDFTQISRTGSADFPRCNP